jgi:transcription elongation factor/antiterminator RfaH
MEHWYVLQSKPQKEKLLYEQLRLRDIEAYYPSIRVKPVNPRARKFKSYFPGYLFVHVDLENVGISSLQWVPGAVGLVNFGGEPAFIAESVLQAIRAKIEQSIASEKNFFRGLKPGDNVSIHDGPFAGYKAIFDTHLSGGQRVQVFLEMLRDQKLRVELPARYLEHVL